MPRAALIYDAHEYAPDTGYVCSDKDHPEHDQSADPADHVQHAPCAECGSAKDAFIHTDEAKATSYVMAVAVEENVSTGEQTATPATPTEA